MTASLFDTPEVQGGADAHDTQTTQDSRRPASRHARSHAGGADHTGRWLDISRSRLIVSACVFALAFTAVGARLVDVSILDGAATARPAALAAEPIASHRADILDRNGVLLATTLPAVSLVANPRQIDDPVGAAMALAGALAGTNPDAVLESLSADTDYVTLQRPLTPQEQYDVNRLGIVGVRFENEPQRYYPAGSLTAHVLGFTTEDRHQDGLAGVERALDDRLTGDAEPLRLSIDLRAQEILTEEIVAQAEAFQAEGAAGVIMDAETAEILALVSWPAFHPYLRDDAELLFNRATQGVYEMGSGFKIFTVATALETGTAQTTTLLDARRPLEISRFTIRDYHGQYRWLSVPEVFIHSSNIGAARLALGFGPEMQQLYFDRLGLLDPAPIEHNEVGAPQIQPRWNETETATISFGHGLAVGVVPMAAAVRAAVVDGIYRPPTLIAGGGGEGEPIFSAATVDTMRRLMRLNVLEGSGRSADVPGYLVGGKTGTAESVTAGGYTDRNLVSFASAFPMHRPRFVIFTMFDGPRPQDAQQRATGGLVAAPVAGRIIERLGPAMGIAPVNDDDPAITSQLAIGRDGTIPPFAGGVEQ